MRIRGQNQFAAVTAPGPRTGAPARFPLRPPRYALLYRSGTAPAVLYPRLTISRDRKHIHAARQLVGAHVSSCLRS